MNSRRPWGICRERTTTSTRISWPSAHSAGTVTALSSSGPAAGEEVQRHPDQVGLAEPLGDDVDEPAADQGRRVVVPERRRRPPG